MHRVPADRIGWRSIDSDRVCAAIEALDHAGEVSRLADLFSVLGDANRLSLLLAVQAAEPISVSDLAIATGLRDTAVSHTLRRLRDMNLVSAHRDGKIVRYSLTATDLQHILRTCTADGLATS